MVTAALQNPLDPLVAEITANQHYLTPHHLEVLAALLPAGAAKDEDVAKANLNLKKQLDQQMKLLARLQTMALGSQDITEVRQVMAASKDLFGLLVRFKEQIGAEDKLMKIEDAVIEALEEVGDEEIKRNFLVKLGKTLPQKG